MVMFLGPANDNIRSDNKKNVELKRKKEDDRRKKETMFTISIGCARRGRASQI